MINKINMIKKFLTISFLLLISFAMASVSIAADTTPPVITFTDDVEIGPVAADFINASITDDTDSGLTYRYGYSSNTTCNTTEDHFFATEWDRPIGILDETNNGKYVCIRAEDSAGNIAYALSANVLNINSRPTNIHLTSTEIDENVADNTEVGVLSNTDQSTSDTYTYTLVDGDDDDDNDDFTISGTSLRIKKKPRLWNKSIV